MVSGSLKIPSCGGGNEGPNKLLKIYEEEMGGSWAAT